MELKDSIIAAAKAKLANLTEADIADILADATMSAIKAEIWRTGNAQTALQGLINSTEAKAIVAKAKTDLLK